MLSSICFCELVFIFPPLSVYSNPKESLDSHSQTCKADIFHNIRVCLALKTSMIATDRWVLGKNLSTERSFDLKYWLSKFSLARSKLYFERKDGKQTWKIMKHFGTRYHPRIVVGAFSLGFKYCIALYNSFIVLFEVSMVTVYSDEYVVK